MAEKKLAIACQGGGALTAYQAGILGALLAEARLENGQIILPLPDRAFSHPHTKAEGTTRYRLVGISGTSGGAQNAAIAWHACTRGVPRAAARYLHDWWHAMAASMSDLTLSGGLTHLMVRSADIALTLCNLSIQQRRNVFDETLRQDFLAQMIKNMPAGLFEKAGHDRAGRLPLFLGAMEAVSGTFACFMAGPEPESDEQKRKCCKYNIVPLEHGLKPENLFASACLPEIFTGQRLAMGKHAQKTYDDARSYRANESRTGAGTPADAALDDWEKDYPPGQYWDGLYSENPPISPFMRTFVDDQVPDEILILRINPRTIPRPVTTPSGLVDRENELIGNLSLTQEIYAIRKINQLLEDGLLRGTRYVRTAVRELDLPWQEQRNLGYMDKLSRFPEEIRYRLDFGRRWGERFMSADPDHAVPPLKDWARAEPKERKPVGAKNKASTEESTA